MAAKGDGYVLTVPGLSLDDIPAELNLYARRAPRGHGPKPAEDSNGCHSILSHLYTTHAASCWRAATAWRWCGT